MSRLTIMKTSPFRSFKLISGNQHSQTVERPKIVGREMNSLALINGQPGEFLSGLTEPKYVKMFDITADNTLRRRLVIYSESSKKQVWIRKLFSKFLWDKLSEIEVIAMIFLALELKDNFVLDTWKASSTVSIELLRARVNALLSYLGKRPIRLREFLSLKGFFLRIEDEYFKYDPPSNNESYTGWSKHHTDKGSLAPDLEIEEPLPVNPEIFADEFNFFIPLSVGTIHLGGEGSLKMALMKAETERFSKLVREFFNESNR